MWESTCPTWFSAEFDWVVDCTYVGLPERRARARQLIRANMWFRHADLLDAGGFRADLGRVGSRPVGGEGPTSASDSLEPIRDPP